MPLSPNSSLDEIATALDFDAAVFVIGIEWEVEHLKKRD